VAALAIGQAFPLAPPGPETASARTGRTPIDLTHPFNQETVHWPTAPQEFELKPDFVGETEGGFYYAAYWFCGAEHGGTHMDAPKHMARGQPAVDAVPLEQLRGPAAVVDVSEQALANRDYQVTIGDLRAWEEQHGRIPEQAILAIRTGYGRYYPDREAYMGTDARGQQALSDLHFPGLHPDAARWLRENRAITAVGIDTPSIDYGQSTQFMAHRHLFEDGTVVLENLAQLERLPATGFAITALPMKIASGSGAPVRAIAWLPEGA